MIRNAMPRFFVTISRMAKPQAGGANTGPRGKAWACIKRGYFRDYRNLPINRRSFFDDFFSDGGRRMALGLRDMQRMMDEMAGPLAFMRHPRSRYPCEHGRTAGRGREVEVKLNDQVFEVKVDVSEYAPKDLNVRIAGERLTITGKYQEKHDEHGMLSREFTRQFVIPEEVEAETMESLLTNDGFLVIKGQVKGGQNIPERNIKIEREAPQKEAEHNPEKPEQ